jgi:hypothetical protein
MAGTSCTKKDAQANQMTFWKACDAFFLKIVTGAGPSIF